MNPFVHASAAERYQRGRPYFHPLVIERIQHYTNTLSFSKGIDVCCGTGQSTVALRSIVSELVGVDISQDMLDQAPSKEGVTYLRAAADKLPDAAELFDIMTISLAFHWLQRDSFLTEANRVLRPQGWLILSNNGFGGEMKGNPEYKEWNQSRYLKRYPAPPRDNSPLTATDAVRLGFHLIDTENYQNEFEFSLDELACYLTTQSNMIAAIESGKESVETAQEWLLKELNPFFMTITRNLSFQWLHTLFKTWERACHAIAVRNQNVVFA